MKIFILDDEVYKHRGSLIEACNGHRTTIVNSIYAAMRFYKGGYDTLLLDHDMEGFYENPAHINTGSQFCRWLALQHGFKLPKRVILHSQNGEGRAAMRELLEKTGIKQIKELPFASWPNYLEKLKEALGT